jgi:branched-chain amino acid transport system substrate-binding protein
MMPAPSAGQRPPPTPLPRRRFLRAALGTGVALGGSLLAACQPQAAPSPPPTSAPAAVASQAPAATGGPASVKIGAVVPLTGRYASGGEQIHNGYELAASDVNAAGGAMVKEFGRRIPLDISFLDDASDPNQTVQRLETLASSDVLVYLGGFGSDLHAAAAAVAEKNKIPYLGVAFALLSIHQQGYKYLFSPFPKSPALAKTAFDLMDSLDPKPAKLALFAEKTDFGAEMDRYWKQEAQARTGYDVTVDEQYAPGSSDFSPMVLHAKSAGVDAILAVPNPPDGIAITKQLKELDLNAKLYSFIRASDSSAWSQSLGKDGDFVLLAPGWSPDLKVPGNAELVRNYQARYNKPPEGTVGAAYACIQVLADALGRATKLDHDGLRDALASTNLANSVIGPVTFNPDGTGNVITVYDQWQGGKQVAVWPKDQAAAPVAYPAKAWSER